MEKARPVSLKEIRIRDNFWDKYRRLVREEILKYQWCAMNDQIEGAPNSLSAGDDDIMEKFKSQQEKNRESFTGLCFRTQMWLNGWKR